MGTTNNGLAWAIQHPKGYFYTNTASTRSRCIKQFMEDIGFRWTWRTWKKHNFRCVKVEISLAQSHVGGDKV